jgi:hypothetical protein
VVYIFNENSKIPTETHAVAYYSYKLKEEGAPKNKTLDRLRNFEGVDTVEKAINYLKEKGVMHNNPVLSEYQAGTCDPQGDYLAYLQANVMGKAVYITAVFMNHALSNKTEDQKLINHIGTLYSKALGFPLGEASVFYVCY